MRIVLRDGGACNSVIYLQLNWHGDFYRDYSANGDSFTVQQGDEWGNWPSTPLACNAPHAYHWNAQWGYQFFADLGAPNGGNPPLGLYYVHGRWYNPEVGLFISPDEKGEYFYGGDAQDAVNYAWQPKGDYNCNTITGCDVSIPITASCELLGQACLLDPRLDKAIVFYAGVYGIPPDLIAATQLAEFVTDWQPWHPYKDRLLWIAASNAGNPIADFDLYLAEALNPGPHEFHLQTARHVERNFQAYYPGTAMANLLTSASTTPALILTLLSTDGQIRYSAALLRELADERTGRRAPHYDDLTSTDKEIIYGAYRAGIGSYGELADFRAAKVPGEAGQKSTFALILYRNYYANVR